MPSRSGPRIHALAALTLSITLVAACSGAGSPSQTTGSTPGASGSTACPSAPAVVGDPAGWGPPTTAPAVVPLIIASAGELVCGPNRVLFTILDKDGRPIGAPDRTAKIAIFNLGRDATKPIATLDGTFIWAIENQRGIYVANTTFPEAGLFGAEFTTAAAGVTTALDAVK